VHLIEELRFDASAMQGIEPALRVSCADYACITDH
jgi:hypothetical protein